MEPIQQQTSRNKYAIIVVGKMGHGKSCFSRMIVSPGERENIKVSSSKKSVTKNCSIYTSQFIQMHQDDELFVIDTPGIDSKNQLYKIIQDIDTKILEQKVSIIGIALVLDIRVRDQNQEDRGYLFQFLQMMRIKYKQKVNLSFLVLSKFDRYYDDYQDNEQIFKQLSEEFSKKGFQKLWNNRILWMSQPEKDKHKFENSLKKQRMRRNIQRTVQKITAIYRKCLEKQAIYLSEYHNKLITKFSKRYHDFQFSKETFTFDIVVKIQRMGFIEGTSYVFREYISNFRTLVKYSLIFAPAIVLMSPIVALIGVYKSQNTTKEQQFKQQMINKLKGMIVSIAKRDMLIIAQKQLYFPKTGYISVEKASNNNKALIVKNKNANFTQVQLKVGENIITVSSKLPNHHYIQQIIQQVSRKYYNKQK